MTQSELKPVTNEGSAFAILTEAFEKVGIKYLVRNGDANIFVFISPRIPLYMSPANMSVEDVPLESLLRSNRFFEFDDDGSLASY